MGRYNILIGNSNIFNFALLNKLVKEEGNIFVVVEDLMTFGQRYIENKYKELFGESLFDFNKKTHIISQNEIACLNICFKELQNSNIWSIVGTNYSPIDIIRSMNLKIKELIQSYANVHYVDIDSSIMRVGFNNYYDYRYAWEFCIMDF